MKLTRYTDYAMRVLIHLAAKPDRLASIGEMSRAYGISHNHLMKVVHDLRTAGYLNSVRGRAGGVMLGKPASEIRVGDVVRYTEGGSEMVDCASCVISPMCTLNGVFQSALGAFNDVLDRYTLADLVEGRREGLLALSSQGAPLASDAEAA